MESKYPALDSLSGRHVVYSRKAGYRVYRQLGDFLADLNAMPMRDRTFHEVIFSRGQKLKFDIDAPVSKLSHFEAPGQSAPVEYDQISPAPPLSGVDPEITSLLNSIDVPTDAETANRVKYHHIFDTILQAIRDTFFIVYGKDLSPDCVVVCESTAVQTKFSNHIIIDGYYVTSHLQAHEFTRRLGSFLPDVYKQFLDFSVNKSIQNFRIVGCHKDEDDRVKLITSGHPVEGAFIANVDNCIQLPDIAARPETTIRATLHADDIQAIIAIIDASGVASDHRLKVVRDGIFIFDRVRPSYCDFCERTHTLDNTLVVSAPNINGVVTIFRHCRKYTKEQGQRGEKIGEIASAVLPAVTSDNVQTDDKVKNWTDKLISDSIARMPLYSTHTLFDSLPPECQHVYHSEALEPFELVETLVVHAPMKMGKTKALAQHIERHFSSRLRPPIIRFISFRQTFSGNIKEKFNDFTLYSDVKGPLSQTKLIVQVESLYRLELLEGSEPPDLLILDECESILEQFDSGLLRGNFAECFAKFQYLMRYSKHVICMDAYVGDRTFRILQTMRPDVGITYHRNTYKNATQDNYYLTGDKLKWLGLLYSCVEADERIAVPMSSLAEAKVLLKNLVKKYPEKKCKLYSSETLMSEKKEHFKAVDIYWSQYDVLIYTPTVSAGVSFEQKHFTKIFGYFTDMSCPVETCIQMIGRIRDVADHQFYICISATGNTLPTSIEGIKKALNTKRENLMHGFDGTGLRIEYTRDGEMVYHGGDYFQLWLENNRIRNLSRNSFVKRFIHMVSLSGPSMHFLSDQLFEEHSGINPGPEGELCEIGDDHKLARSEVRSDQCKNIAAAPDLQEQEIEEIRADIVAQRDISDERRYAFEKYRLRSDYRYDSVIDAAFVGKYYDTKTRRIFKNLARVYSHETIDDAIKQIQAEECANHKYLMSMGEDARYQDLNRKYVFDQHRYAISLLKLCGWAGIDDPKYIHKIILSQNLLTNDKLYWDNIGAACIEFKIKMPKLLVARRERDNPDELIKVMIKPINKILSLMYGMSIAAHKQDHDMFYISTCSLFTFDPVRSQKKHMPLIVRGCAN